MAGGETTGMLPAKTLPATKGWRTPCIGPCPSTARRFAVDAERGRRLGFGAARTSAGERPAGQQAALLRAGRRRRALFRVGDQAQAIAPEINYPPPPDYPANHAPRARNALQ